MPPFRYGTSPRSFSGLLRALPFLLGKALEEERAEEIAVVAVLAEFLAGSGELVLEVVRVPAKKALLLDEVDEHQAVEHHRDIPALHLRIGDALQELEERGMLGLEAVVETSW